METAPKVKFLITAAGLERSKRQMELQRGHSNDSSSSGRPISCTAGGATRHELSKLSGTERKNPAALPLTPEPGARPGGVMTRRGRKPCSPSPAEEETFHMRPGSLFYFHFKEAQNTAQRA